MSKKIQIQEWRFPPYDSVKKRLQEAGIGIFDKIQSRKSWKKAILENRVLVNGKIGSTSTWVEFGNEIELLPDINSKNNQINDVLISSNLIEILYEDNEIIIVVKPCGITTSNYTKQNLKYKVCKQLHNNYLHPAHRLDKDTHGLVIFYKNKSAAIWLEKMFKKRQIQKTYYALIEGDLKGEKIEINSKIDEKDSHTIIRKIGTINWPVHKLASFVKITPLSGRKHQIRKHLKTIGHPVVGDLLYNSGVRYKGHGLFLSCTNLDFENPITGEAINVRAKLPKKFKGVLRKLYLP
tara:strand:+ start:322 stop:1203 length:882 start_codon:yes stop_codon:yes gene_type:complete